MNVLDAIYSRRATRNYTDRPVPKDAIELLIKAAIHAPSAMNLQPWAFGVIHCNHQRLEDYSKRAKAFVVDTLEPGSPLYELRDSLLDPNFNLFYNAGTLIIIYAKPSGTDSAEDCCFAAENMMLAAAEMGLATCPIGLARPWLNLPETKQELGVPAGYTAVTPLILGYPNETPETPQRKVPEIVFWK